MSTATDDLVRTDDGRKTDFDLAAELRDSRMNIVVADDGDRVFVKVNDALLNLSQTEVEILRAELEEMNDG